MSSAGAPEPGVAAPGNAQDAFGARLGLAERYAALLTGPGIERGVIGPREAERIWQRHLLNSAALADLLPAGGRVVDVGSGAGLPGVPIAIRAPELTVDLVEPLQRRAEFLSEVAAELGLGSQLRVVRGRAEDAAVRKLVGSANWVVARAVAPLDRLVRWCLPLLAPGGRLLALKGQSADSEVAQHRAALRGMGVTDLRVEELNAEWLDTATWVVVAQRGMG